MRRVLVAIPLAALALGGLAACGGDTGSDKKASSDATVKGLTVTGDFAEEPKLTVDGVDVSKPKTLVLIQGDGPVAAAGGQALVNVVIANATTGKTAVSTFDQEKPAEAVLTPDQLPQDVIDALDGEHRGSRVAVVGPVSTMIGPDGADQVGLGKDDDVVYIVDIVSVKPTDILDGPDGTPGDVPAEAPVALEKAGKVTGFDFSPAPKKPGAGLQVITLVEGDGPAIAAGRYVAFNYFGEVYGGKKPFDESYTKEPVTFAVGIGSLIKGWDEGLIGVKAGSRVMLIVPSDYGYGDQGTTGIPGGATLVFVLDVLGVDG